MTLSKHCFIFPEDCAYEPNDEMASHDEGFGSDSEESEIEEEKVFAELSSEGGKLSYQIS